jgi:hypothetical protein
LGASVDTPKDHPSQADCLRVLSRQDVRKPTVPRDDQLARLFRWLDTEEGMLSMKAIDEVAAALEGVELDVEKRRIVWPGGKRLTIEQTARRLQNRISADLRVVESHIMCWMEKRFEPEGLDVRQMEALAAQISRWIKDHRKAQGTS